MPMVAAAAPPTPSSSSTTNTSTSTNTNTTSSKLISSRKKGKINGKTMKKVRKVTEKRYESGLKSTVNSVAEVLVDNSNTTNGDVSKDEVEEGELGTLPVENVEFIAEIPTITPRKYGLKSEIERGEIVEDKWLKGGGKVEKGETFSSGKWRKPEGAEKNGYISGHWRISSKEESDKAEYVPERRRKSEVVKEDYVYPRARRHDSDNGWKGDGGCTAAPSQYSQYSSGKYSNVKELSRSGNQFKKKFSRYEGSVLDRGPRLSSKIVDDVWSDFNDGKVHSREYNSVNGLKRQAVAADTSDWSHPGDSDDYTSSKIRKVSDNATRTAHSSEHYTSHATGRSHKNTSFLSKNASSDKYSSRHLKSSLKVTYDKYHSERSPHDRAHHHDHRDRSPVHYERTPYDRSSRYDLSKSPNEQNHGYGYSRSPHGRSHPYSRSRSPYDRSRHVDNRKGSPSCSVWSPPGQSRHQDCEVQTPSVLEQSPAHGRLQDMNRISRVREKKQVPGGNRGPEGKPKQHKDQSEPDLQPSAKESEHRSKSDDNDDSRTEIDDAMLKEEIFPDPDANTSEMQPEAPRESGYTEDLASMEEDMDICNTPPQDPLLPDACPEKWFYLDHIGEEQGPSRLSDLKKLVEQGFLMSDHLIKHCDSDRWVTVENAVSPLVTTSFPSIVSDTVTELVSPPEAPGNLLVDSGEVSDSCQPIPISLDSTSYHESCLLGSETLKDLLIEERVEALLEGLTVFPGRELEIVGEALQMTFVNAEWEKWGISEAEFGDQMFCEDASEPLSIETKEVNSTILVPTEEDISLNHDSDEWFSGLWPCKGGDWKRNDEDLLDRPWKRKVVLNDGYPLCQEKCFYEDPRWQQKDELHYSSHGRKFDLPSWAFTSPEEWNDGGGASRSAPSKFNNVRGSCGTILPVVGINACVVKDHDSFGSEQHVKVRGKDRYSSRSTRNYSVSSDRRRSSEEGYSHPKITYEQDSGGSWKNCIPTSFSAPKDRICTVDELNLHLGDWYYFDGAGHERGPLSFSEFQAMTEQGAIPKNSSIFRKVDKIWIPVFSAAEVSISGERTQKVRNDSFAETSGESLAGLYKSILDGGSGVSGTFHSLHPQFIGYTSGKLHELVMKSYKSREFAAAINEVLDPWINTRLPKKEMDRHIYGSVLFQKSDQVCASKRFGIDEIEEEDGTDDLSGSTQVDCSFDELCSDAIFRQELDAASKIERGYRGQLDGCVLARVFHFLRADIRSLVNVTLTCNLWRRVVSCYKDASRHVDLSSLAPNCNDTMMWNIMNGYDKEKVHSLILRGCTGITFSMLEEVLKSFLNLACVDIRGCNQFEELVSRCPHITWIRNRCTELKIRTVKHLSDKQLDDSSGLRDYLENADRRDSAKLFRQSLYKRSKLFDARKSSSILSRDANLSRFSMRKSNIAYKRMEDFLDSGLKDIMKENTFDFFVPKVSRIEDRMKSGYYAKRGLSSVKEDIMQMCRGAIKKKNRSDVSGINRIVTLFFRLATSLESGSKFADRDEIMKTWKEDSPPGFPSVSSNKYKKNYSKANDKKSIIRSNGSSFMNSISDYGDNISDREIRRCLSKLHKKLDSGSETSDNMDRSSDEGLTDSETTDSNTASDSDLRSEGGTGESRLDAYSPDEGFDSFTDEREWGARMTKASLVPPVARKYEVIDHYVVVADEEEVRRKMQVSLPEDYAEKLNAQKSGVDETDMQIPEVKDYKPRKCLGVEVIEQEVYGIDPYTHNLLLDSVPEDSDWSPQDMNVFIEDVLLRTLNKQVRHFTGSGNTPMTYPLKSVFEEILETAVENNDWRTSKLSEGFLKAIDSRPVDNYVAYRKGLGVVCNKDGGFSEDDFVVEFLGEVYPTWKWFEKQDGIRSLQKNSKDPAPEFYNIYLERPKGDADGYDLVVVDAMHKANYASRICHSCRPNSEAKVTAVDGQYQIGIYSVRPIQYGEEISFDYNSVTESKEEYEASVCLCGSHVCRGSFLNLTGEGAFLKVLKEYHGILDRQRLILEACEINSVSDEDYIDLLKAGLGSCLLDGLPDWLVAYSARLVRFINFERLKLPKEILKHNLEEKKKYFADISLEVEKSDAEVQAEGVYNQRLQNLALTLDKVRYVMRCVFGDPKKAPPPLERLSPQEAASYIWSGEGSLVHELIQCMAPHMENSMLSELQAKIRAHDPSGANNIVMELQKSLIWLRDEVRNLPCGSKCRHDAAADLIHIYAHTKSFFRIREYKSVTSPPVYISSLDLCPKYADKLGSDGHEYCKTYGENYCLGQLIYWYSQANADPDGNLARASRGCMSLPDIGSFYAKGQKPARQRVYGPRTVKFMLSRMEKQPQRPWPKDRIWTYKNNPKIVGSPMLDAVIKKAPLDKDMLHWLKHRIPIFQAQWDR